MRYCTFDEGRITIENGRKKKDFLDEIKERGEKFFLAKSKKVKRLFSQKYGRGKHFSKEKNEGTGTILGA